MSKSYGRNIHYIVDLRIAITKLNNMFMSLLLQYMSESNQSLFEYLFIYNLLRPIDKKMQNKLTFQKIYIVFLAILGSVILLILCTSVIGFFTSRRDDELYIIYIKSDLDTMKSDLSNTTYKKIQTLTESGAIFLTYDREEGKIIGKKSSSASFSKIQKAIYDSNTEEFMKVIDKKEEITSDADKFAQSSILESSGLFASFGDAFSFRLLLVMRKVFDGIKELTLQADEGTNSYLSVLVDQKVVVLTLFEKSSTKTSFLVSRLEYLIPDINGRPHLRKIMQHVFFRLFCTQ